MALSKYLGYELGHAMLCWQKLCPARPCPIHPPRRRLMITLVAYADITWRKSHNIEIIDIVLVAVIIKILRSESEESPRRPFDDTTEPFVRRRWNFDRPLPVLDLAAPKVIPYYEYLLPIIIIIYGPAVFLDGDNNNNYYYWSRGRPTSPTRTAVYDVKW